jgi:hypothetical protein
MSDSNELGSEQEFADDDVDDDDVFDDDDVSPDDQLLLDRKELHELGLELDNPEGFADE